MVKRQLAILLAGIGILTVGISTPVFAEEYEPAGYHVYDVQEEEATDTWYGVARGDYLQAGIAKVNAIRLCQSFRKYVSSFCL